MNTILITTIVLSTWLIARLARTHFFIGMFGTGIEINALSVNFHFLNLFDEMGEDRFPVGMMLEIYLDPHYWCVRGRGWKSWQFGPVSFYGPNL